MGCSLECGARMQRLREKQRKEVRATLACLWGGLIFGAVLTTFILKVLE
jgi:hypothetical protein